MTEKDPGKKRDTGPLSDIESKRRNESDRYTGKTNVADYNIPSGVQLTENMKEEIVEEVLHATPEAPPEK